MVQISRKNFSLCESSHYYSGFIRMQTNFLLQIVLAGKWDGKNSTHNPVTKEEDRLEQTTNPGQLPCHQSSSPAPHCKAATSLSLSKPALQNSHFVFPV